MKSALFLFIGLLLSFSNTGYAAMNCSSETTGMFASAIGRGDHVLTDPAVQGVLVRSEWKRIEPEPGVFDFSSIDRQVERIRKAKKAWSLAVLAGPHSPQWLKRNPYSAAAFHSPRFGQVEIPLFWDDGVLERVDRLAKALAERYADDKSLAIVYIPQMTMNGVEGHFNGISNKHLKSIGLTKQNWVDAVHKTALSFAKYFTSKEIVIELHEINRSIDIPRAIVNSFSSAEKLRNKIGFGVWWLSGKTQYQGALLDFLKFEVSAPLYAQLIGHSGQSHRFKDGSIETAFAQARDMNICYIEAWNYEFENKTSDDLFKRFNNATK